MSRWRIMLEAALLYIGGLSMGGVAGYEIAAAVRGRTNMFAGDDAIIALGIIAVGVVAGPFALSALTTKWPNVTYPVLAVCGLVVLTDLAYVIYAIAIK